MSNVTLADGSIVITVYGSPAPQGSKKGFVNKKTGRAIVVEQLQDRVKTWREAVKTAALEATTVDCDHEPRTCVAHRTPILGCPVVVKMVFTMRKPASAPKRFRSWPSKMPDLSKLCRATEDALTDAGIWEDDARVVEYSRLAKVYPFEDRDALDAPGVRIVVTPLVRSGDELPPAPTLCGAHMTPRQDPPPLGVTLTPPSGAAGTEGASDG